MSKTCKSNLVIPPNKQLEATFEFSTNPKIYDYLFYVDFNEAGNCILGSSNITGTFWEGTVTYYEDIEHLLKFSFSNCFMYLTSSDAKFMNRNTIALADDTGILNILYLKEDEALLVNLEHFKHIQRIPQVGVWNHSTQVLTCSGRGVSIWDIGSMKNRPSFSSCDIHMEDVATVDTFKSDTNSFVSGSCDRKALLWDIRTEKPPLVLYSNEFCPISRIAINQTCPDELFIGTEAGTVYQIDKRNVDTPLHVTDCFDAKINAISIDSTGNQVAVVGNTKQVKVFSTVGSDVTIYKNDHSHSGFVKDAKWFGDALVTCGFGKRQLCKHQVY